MFTPKVYIVILNRNQRLDTLACLQSLTRIDYPNYKIIVVDNQSSDGSLQAIQLYYPDARLIEMNNNMGVSGGRNCGLQVARLDKADYVLFLDNDTIVRSDFLALLVGAMESEPEIGIASSLILHDENKSICWMAGGLINKNGTVSALYFNQPVAVVPQADYDVDWVPGCVLMTRKEVYNQLVSFDDIFFFYFEDVDWCARASKKGYRIVVVPRSVVIHKISRSLGGSYSPQRLYYWVRNRLYFAKRYSPHNQRTTIELQLIIEELGNAIGDLQIHHAEQAKARSIGIIHYLFGRTGEYEVFSQDR